MKIEELVHPPYTHPPAYDSTSPANIATTPAYGSAIHLDAPGSIRSSQSPPLTEELPTKKGSKKGSKWTPKEDNLIIELRGQGVKWDDIADRLPGRSSTSCRLHYQNYLEKRAVWDEEKKNNLARLYARFKEEMWQKVATEMGIPWRSAESMHWKLGEHDIAKRANVPIFQLHSSADAGGTTNQEICFEPPRQISVPAAFQWYPSMDLP